MIQFNLLPDVKLEYIKATYRRRIVSLVCFIVAASFLAIFILMFFFVRVNQTRQLSNLDKEINSNLKTLRENQDLDKVLTIQNQLDELPKLHQDKAMTSRFFAYLPQLRHDKMFVTSVSIDVVNKSLVVKGETDSIANVNKFVDTLKYTKYSINENGAKTEGQAFSSVVLSNFTIAPGTINVARSVSFEVAFNYDPVIFKNTAGEGKPLDNTVTLTVPAIISTPSETQKPSIAPVSNTQIQQDGGIQ